MMVLLRRWMTLLIVTIAATALVNSISWSDPNRRHVFRQGGVVKLRGGAGTKDEGYSFSLTTFSPRGSLNQIEYAMNSASEGALAVAAQYDCPHRSGRGIAVASLRKPESSLIVELIGTRKITPVSDRIVLLYSGLAADSRILARRAQECCLEYQAKYGDGDAVLLETLVSEVALVMQEYTQMAGVRPFGVTLLMAGIDIDGTSQIYRIDPSGAYSSWKGCAIGKGSEKAEEILEKCFKESSLERDRALELVLSTVLRCSPTPVRRQDVDIAFVEGGTVNTLNPLDVL